MQKIIDVFSDSLMEGVGMILVMGIIIVLLLNSNLGILITNYVSGIC